MYSTRSAPAFISRTPFSSPSGTCFLPKVNSCSTPCFVHVQVSASPHQGERRGAAQNTMMRDAEPGRGKQWCRRSGTRCTARAAYPRLWSRRRRPRRHPPTEAPTHLNRGEGVRCEVPEAREGHSNITTVTRTHIPSSSVHPSMSACLIEAMVGKADASLGARRDTAAPKANGASARRENRGALGEAAACSARTPDVTPPPGTARNALAGAAEALSKSATTSVCICCDVVCHELNFTLQARQG